MFCDALTGVLVIKVSKFPVLTNKALLMETISTKHPRKTPYIGPLRNRYGSEKYKTEIENQYSL
jgi:hypothetical protein